jgi:hypothetical protein
MAVQSRLMLRRPAITMPERQVVGRKSRLCRTAKARITLAVAAIVTRLGKSPECWC